MGISLFLITRYNKCVISRVFISFIGVNTEDLVFNKVTVMEGFYINIILKALIIKVGV